jgi:hypothetical protein
MTKQTNIQTGNAWFDAKNGWFVGSFMDEKLGLRSTKDVEIKWAIHPAGEWHPKDWVTGEARTAIAILISGKWEMMFRDKTAILSQPGDFVMWGKGDDHKGRALEDSVVLVIRWPSIRQY